MAGTAIQNIKILHKRYSSAQWLNGIQINGETIIPTLAQGEIGLATDTLEVRIGTNSVAEQTFAQARPIDADVMVVKKDANGATITNTAGLVVTDVSLERDETSGKHKLTATYGKISVGEIEGFPDFAVVGTNTVTAGEGEIKVITEAKENNSKEHQLDVTYGTAATKSYVDTKFSTAKYVAVEDGGTNEDDGSGTITYVSKVEESTADHTIKVTKQKLVLPTIEVDDKTTGEYISGIEVDSSDDHKLVVTRAALPTLSTAANSGNGNGKTVVGGISVNGHEITATKKTIEGSGDAITVTGTSDTITITVDTYTKAQIDTMHEELGKAMEFIGTLASDGTGTATSLPAATTATIGHVYKVAVAGTYGGKSCKVGDVFICDTTPLWRYIPSGDDIEDTWRPISVNGTAIPDAKSIEFKDGDGIEITSDANGNITVSHDDTSNVGDLTKASRTYVDGLTFDEYGHVTGYTVGSETVVDTNTAHAHTAGAKLTISGSGGVDGSVEYSHETITTSTSADSSKNVTVTAGGGDNKFTVVDSLIDDGYGHITGVKTKEITVNVPKDEDTTYDLELANNVTGVDATIALKGSNDTVDNINFKGEGATEIKVENGIIKIKSENTEYELATAALAGLLKVANVLSEAASGNAATLNNYSGNHNDKLYGVNRKADGTAFVEVPWTDTKYTASNGLTMVGTDVQHDATGVVNAAVDLYAFGTDSHGHVSSAVPITIIDGNYA